MLSFFRFAKCQTFAAIAACDEYRKNGNDKTLLNDNVFDLNLNKFQKFDESNGNSQHSFNNSFGHLNAQRYRTKGLFPEQNFYNPYGYYSDSQNHHCDCEGTTNEKKDDSCPSTLSLVLIYNIFRMYRLVLDFLLLHMKTVMIL
jgi:hypothetical protein